MKKLLFTIHSMPIGGAEKVLLDILDNMDYDRYQVDLLLYTHEGENLSRIPEQVNVLWAFKPQKRNLINRIYNKILNTTGLIDSVERHKTRKAIGNRTYDSIISFCQGPGHKLHTFLKDKAPNHISWIHNDLSKENWGKLFFANDIKKQEKAYGFMNTIVHVSEGVKTSFNATFNIPDNVKQQVILNIVDVADIIKKSKDEIGITKPDSFLFINSGRLVSQKKQIRLVEAAALLRSQNKTFKIWILGEGPLRTQLESRINELDLNDYVELKGAVLNPYPYIATSDCFVLTSSQEGFSIVVCEALSLGKPVISTKVVGPTELLDNSKYGILVDEDVRQIADTMKAIMENDELRKKYSEASLRRAEQFDVQTTMSEIYSIF